MTFMNLLYGNFQVSSKQLKDTLTIGSSWNPIPPLQGLPKMDLVMCGDTFADVIKLINNVLEFSFIQNYSWSTLKPRILEHHL
jgi:hypothetical protein